MIPFPAIRVKTTKKIINKFKSFIFIHLKSPYYTLKAFALTCGILWGVGLFFLTWWLILLEGSSGDPTLIGRFYVGYNISPSGSIIGFLWGCADGAIGGLAFGWLYNFIILQMAIKKHKTHEV